MEKGGAVRCSDSGASLLQSCAGDVVIDTKGVIRCPAAVGLPVCTLAAAPSSITQGASSVLTASCNPLASTYVWTGVPLSFGTGATGLVYPTVTTTYTVKGVSSTGQQGLAASKTVTVPQTSSSTPASPPSCTLSQQAGQYKGSTYLVSSCNPAATSYRWSSNATYNGSGCSTSDSNCLVNPSTSTTYSMTGSNAMGSGNTASITVAPTASCTLTASLSTVLQGSSSVLTANCSPAAESYTWSAPCDATPEPNKCTVTPANTATYSVVGNVAGIGATSQVSTTVTVTLPSCTLTASKATIGLGDSSTLTASCSPPATGYTWTGGTCESTTTNACTVTPPTAGTTSYSVTGTGANTATSAPTTVTVVDPYCSVTANTTSVSPGGTSILTANCSPAATGYTWTGGTCDKADANTCSVSPDVTTDYSVTGTGANTATSPALTVTVSSTPAGCSIAPVSWSSGLAAYEGGTPVQTINGGEMKAWSMKQTSHPASIARLSYSLCGTDFSISENACEWGTPDLIAKNCSVANRVDPKIVNQTSDQPPLEGKCVLDAGKTYYFNVRPVSSTVSGCTFYLTY
ncbi:MAG: hypothetical protein ACYC2E_09015 [Sulfuricella sp.]